VAITVRTIYGMLAAGAVLFLASAALAIYTWRNSGSVPTSDPVASVQQLMQAVVVPSSRAIYDAVSTTVTVDGTEERVPRTDREWQVVGSHAQALVEAANLLKVRGRARDGGDWIRMSDAMAKGATIAYRAAKQKDPEALLAAGEVLNNSCDSCHRNYDVPVQ
jgi:hypothetical protein